MPLLVGLWRILGLADGAGAKAQRPPVPVPSPRAPAGQQHPLFHDTLGW